MFLKSTVALAAVFGLIDALVDRVIDANMQFPWTYVCRALAGVDTAIWDFCCQINPAWLEKAACLKTDRVL